MSIAVNAAIDMWRKLFFMAVYLWWSGCQQDNITYVMLLSLPKPKHHATKT